MQYNNVILLQVIDIVVEIMEQDVIVVFVIDVLFGEFQVGDVLVWYLVVGVFVVVVIIVLQYLDFCVLQNIQDVFLMVCQFFIIMCVWYIGEYVWYGNCGCCVVGSGMWKIDYVVLLYQWVGVV